MIDFTDIVIALIGVIFAVVSTYIAPKLSEWLIDKRLYTLAAVLVKAASTYFSDGEGKKKADWVFGELDKRFGKYIDADRIRAAIQAGYVDYKSVFGEKPSPAPTLKE